jgi:haloacid dehalogenase superfamily, subfamily IA, variant 1 with third motif having Dx(3-4)D or Dx(3-4)E
MTQSRKKYKAVIFDLDGTLINSLQDIGDSMNRVLAAQGFPTHDYDAYRYFVGRGLRTLVGRALPEGQRTEEVVDVVYTALMKDYAIRCLDKTRLYEGIPEMLDSLTAQDLKLAILSNKSHNFTLKITDELVSNWPFKVILGTNEETPRKPDPTGAFHIIRKLGITPEEVLYVGDTSTDMKTAVAAGFFPVGVTWGFRTKEELLENGALAIIDKPQDLLNLL